MNPRLLPLLVFVSCSEYDAEPAPSVQKSEAQDKEGWGGAPAGAMAPAPPPAAPARGDMARQASALGYDGNSNLEMELEPPADAKGHEGGRAGAAPARAWFPESFLWMPMVETNAAGVATVPLTVPDTLTTWRVLALGQSAEGAQGGAVGEFVSTLPAYVDVVAPSFVYAGDRLTLPVQVVNQQDGALGGQLTVEAGGRTWSDAVRIDPGGSAVRAIPLAPAAPGDLLVRADLAGVDSVERHVEVRPAGRRVDQVRGGTLAGARTLTLDGVPGGRYGGLAVTVFPGGRSVIAREVAVAGRRGGGLAEAAYAYALAGQAQPLAGAGDVTDQTLRDLSLVALQQLTRATRAPDAGVAALGHAGLRGAEKDTLAGRLADRLADTVRRAQQPDGLFGLQEGAPLDEVLVHTARAVWALGPAGDGARLRAQGAFERFDDRLDTPAVAAWALAAGLVEGPQAESLRAEVTAALTTAPDGTKRLAGAGTVSDAEATALAALVLADEGVRADLAASLLTRYSTWQGFGPGYANLVALDALRTVMGGEIPASVKVRMTVDGRPAGEAALDPSSPYVPITLRGPAVEAPGPHEVRLEADPAVPGLAFTLTASTWLAWEAQAPAGLELRVTPAELRRGERSTLTLEVAGPPSGTVDLDVGLPAGVSVDPSSLPPGTGDWRVEDGALHVTGAPLVDGAWRVGVTVTPEVAGTLQSGPSEVRWNGASYVRVPTPWVVR